jgi:branched-chain amino acid transport system permease protein
VVMFMPEGVIPAASSLFRRFFGPREASIREVTAAELLDNRRAPDEPAAAPDTPEGPDASDDTAEADR